MLLQFKAPEQFKSQEIDDAMWIEEILTRAHEIHRAHSGLFGYELEDWLEAERELAQSTHPLRRPAEETTHVESRCLGQESKKCYGLHH